VSSDSSCFSPFWWKNLLEEVGEQWCSPIDRIECHYGDVGGRCHHEGTRIGATEHLVGVEARREVRAPACQISVGVCLDRTFLDAGRQLMKVIDEDPIWRQKLPGSQFCEKIGSIIVLLGDMM